jgi:hypothetical protein
VRYKYPKILSKTNELLMLRQRDIKKLIRAAENFDDSIYCRKDPKSKISCGCGSVISNATRYDHEKTHKHKLWLSNPKDFVNAVGVIRKEINWIICELKLTKTIRMKYLFAGADQVSNVI